MLAGARLLGARTFAVNSVSDASGSVLFVNAGELDASHRAACDFVSAHFRFPVDRLYPRRDRLGGRLSEGHQSSPEPQVAEARLVRARRGGAPARGGGLPGGRRFRFVPRRLRRRKARGARCGEEKLYAQFADRDIDVRAYGALLDLSQIDAPGRSRRAFRHLPLESRATRSISSRESPDEDILVIADASRFLPVKR